MTPQFRHGVSWLPIGEPLDHEQVNGFLWHVADSNCWFRRRLTPCRTPNSQGVERSFRMKTQAMGRPDMSCVSPRATSVKPLAL